MRVSLDVTPRLEGTTIVSVGPLAERPLTTYRAPLSDSRLLAHFLPRAANEPAAGFDDRICLCERRLCWRQRSQTSIAGSKAAIPSGASRKTDVPQSAQTLSPVGETLKRRTVLLGDGQPAAAGDRTANIGGRARRAPPAARPQSDAGETRPQQDGDGASTFF